MGRDKALLRFCGRPMVQIAVTTLSQLCEHVAISGNREDLAEYAPVVVETRHGEGPIAGIEAGLEACNSRWALFLPVDLPLLPVYFLAAWADAVLALPAARTSYVSCNGNAHPAISLVRRECLAEVRECIESGERSIQRVLQSLDGFCTVDAATIADPTAAEVWLMNVNTPEQLAVAELTVREERCLRPQNRILPSIYS